MSDGSVSTTSSRIKQFGLYRTIDARTEEFLRLSRKRQLKQGCACAAVSTAITVTIVVGVILIYEYGIVSEFSPNSIIKPNWLALMNTSDSIPFEAKFNKTSISLDSSIRLLPLILKALNKNIYYDKIIEDDKKEETENIFTNNIFSDSSLQIPASSIYAIEYKTPIVIYKNPTRNTDYYTKTRRIKDYQRIMNYVNKMINERITAASTVAMLKNSYAFDKNLPITTVDSIKRSETKRPQKKAKSINTTKKKKCSCTKQMNQLLSNMITLLQKLLPNSTHEILRKTKTCDDGQTLSTKTKKIGHEITTLDSKNKLKSLAHLNKAFPMKSKESPTKAKETGILLQTPFPKVKHNLKSLIQLIISNKFLDKSKTAINFNKQTVHKSAIRKQSMADTENYYVLSDETTESLPIIQNPFNISSTSIIMNKTSETIGRDLINTTDFGTKENDESYPIDKKKEDYTFTSPTSSIIDNFLNLDIHAMELVKSKLIPKRIKTHYVFEKSDQFKEIKKKYDNTNNRTNDTMETLGTFRKIGQLKKSDLENKKNVDNSVENNYSSMRKNGKMVRLEPNAETNSEQYAQHHYRPLRKFGQMIMSESRDETNSKNSHDVRRDTLLQNIYTMPDLVSTDSSTMKYSTTRLKQLMGKTSSFKINQRSSDYGTLEDEDGQNFYEDIPTLINFKKIEKSINLFNNSVAETDNIINNNTKLFYFGTDTENINSTEEENTELNFPKSRTSYLEIQRNNWEHFENED